MGKSSSKIMLETLAVYQQPKRYVVSVGQKILIVTHDYRIAMTIENDIVRRNITNENYSVVVSKKN